MKFTKLINLFLITIICAVVYFLYKRVIYSFGFTDEGDNISIGQYLLMGKSLYRDIFSQHQPLTYYISSAIQFITHPDNVLLVVRRHRQFVMGFSFIWTAFLMFRFGSGLFPFLVIIEIFKYYFLGHLFLAESLVIYPLVYLLLIWWEVWEAKKITLWDAIGISLSCFFVIFNLLPTITVAGVILLMLLYRYKNNKGIFFALIAPLTITTSILFLIVPLFSYIDGAIWANLAHYIPNATFVAFNVTESRNVTLMKVFLYPFLSFFYPSNVLVNIYRFLAVAWIFGAIYFSANKGRILSTLVLVVILSMGNLRPAFGTHIFFHSFHSLPFFALFVMSLYLLLKNKSLRWIALQRLSILLVCAVFFYTFFSKDIFFKERLRSEDIAYINFSEVFTYSDTIQKLSDLSDSLMVVPHEELLYWYPKLLPPTRFLFYKAWVYDVPQYRAEIEQNLKTNPPMFVYWPEDNLEPFLDSDDYYHVPKNTATYSALHIHRNKLPYITSQQWEAVSSHGFRKPL